jgi:hypothetical protein
VGLGEEEIICTFRRMRMNVMTVVLLLIVFGKSFAQDKRTIFKLLPVDCTPDLSKAERDSLLINRTYTLPGGDSTDTVQYSLDTTGDADFFSYGQYYTTGQRGFLHFEVLSLPRSDGGKVILFSRVGGAPFTFSQQELRVFNFSKGRLKESKEKLLPVTVDPKHFLSAGTPDSIMKHIDNYISSSYDFAAGIKNTIAYQLLIDDAIKRYVEREVVYFKWNGKKFVMKKEEP